MKIPQTEEFADKLFIGSATVALIPTFGYLTVVGGGWPTGWGWLVLIPWAVGCAGAHGAIKILRAAREKG